jgi:hypothetical protein
MKHILNDLTEQEKNSIREQHTGGMKVMTESFSKLINSKLGDVKPILSEQANKKISGSPKEFLMNNSSEPNPALGVTEVPECFKYDRSNENLMSNYPPTESEIEHYIDYLGVYGDVPGTGIPIPYQSSDLQYMIQLLQGSGTPASMGSNFKELGHINGRTAEYKGKIYPVVDLIRANFNGSKYFTTLGKSLNEKLTDSDKETKQKEYITSILENAYKVWIDCVNQVRTNI